MVSRSASGGHDDGLRHDACGRAEWPRNAKAVPALGSPRFLERHAGPDDRKAGPAAQVGDPLVDRSPRSRGPSGVTHRCPRSIRRLISAGHARRPGSSSPEPR